MSGSPAINTADPNYAPGEDILRNKRPIRSEPYIGAVEYQAEIYIPIVISY
jgi:hypothetical protein